MKLPLRSRNRLLPYPKVLFVLHLSNNSLFYGKDIGPFQVGQKIWSNHRFHYPGRRKWLQLSGITPLQKNHLIGKWSEHLQIWKAVLVPSLADHTYVSMGDAKMWGGKDICRFSVSELCIWALTLGKSLSLAITTVRCKRTLRSSDSVAFVLR